MTAEQHIRHYNRLNGNVISTHKLAAFALAIQRDIDAKRIDSHVPFGVELLDIKKRIDNVLRNAKKDKYLQIELKPIPLNKYKPVQKKKVVKAKPAPKKVAKKIERKPVKKSIPVKKEKFVASKRLEGIVNSDQIKKMSFRQIPIDGIYKELFNKLYYDTQLMFWGVPGSGKTVGLLQFADYLSDRMGMKALYLANEELNRSTLSEKLNQFEISNKIDFAKNFKDLEKAGKKLSDYDVIFFDSIQSLGIDLDDYKKLVEDNRGKMFVLIVQSTKDGDFKGGKEWEHEVDIAAEFINRKLVFSKNRLDPDMAKKSEALHLEHAVNERKKKHLISNKVKEQLKPVSETVVYV